MKRREVVPIDRSQCRDFVLNRHYAHRWPSISHSFGLVDSGELRGIVTYGNPSSAPLRDGVAGKSFSDCVIELNRLCLLKNEENEASMLVGRSLKMLPKPSIVISFADTSLGHVGYVYQACNFTYHGLSAKRTDWKIKGAEHMHGQTIADQFRGVKNRAEAMRSKYGDKFYLEDRPRKHRYIFVVGSKSQRRKIMRSIKYPEQPYPKGKSSRYKISAMADAQQSLFT